MDLIIVYEIHSNFVYKQINECLINSIKNNAKKATNPNK
jgi:hypothetical protein